MKKLLIFDAYGTLLSTGNGSIEATKKILALQDKEIDTKAFYADWKRYHRKHIDECNAGLFRTEADIFVKDLKALYEKYDIIRAHEQDAEIMLESLVGRKVFPEVLEAIEKLSKEYRVVIGSTTDTEPLLINMEQNGLIADAVYTSEMMKVYKPAEAFYQYILEHENYKAGEAVFIGDSLVDDIAGPQGLGITTVLVDRTNKYSRTEEVQPDFVVNSIAQLCTLEY